ncbi:MAG: hypothetical protein WB586_24825 [Chthoniobacterales bacterium]
MEQTAFRRHDQNMICRMWKGWTTDENADRYASYLEDELFPRLQRELHGYRGYHVLRLGQSHEVEFVTMVWFESLAAVRSFAGETYEVPVISDKAQRLLSRYEDRCDHYELSSFQAPWVTGEF